MVASRAALMRRSLTLVAGIAGVTLLVGLVIHAGPARLAAQLYALRSLLPLLLILTGARYVLQAAGWRLAIPQADRPDRITFIQAVIAGEGIGYVTWGPIAREPAKALFVTPRVPARIALRAAVAERVVFMLAAIALAVIGAALLIMRRRFLMPVAGATAVLVIGLVIVRRIRRRRLTSMCGICLPPPTKLEEPSRGGDETGSRLGAASDLWQQPGVLSRLAALAIAQEALNVLEVYLIFVWLGAGPTVTVAIAFAGLSALLGAAGQLVPGGLGVFEASGALLAGALSLGASHGISLALVRRLRSLIWAVPGMLLLVHRGYYGTLRPIGRQTAFEVQA